MACAGDTVWTAGGGGTAAGAEGVSTEDWHAACTDTHAAMSRKRNDLQNTARPLRSMIRLLIQNRHPLEDETDVLIGYG
jgi:hypothetical protein